MVQASPPDDNQPSASKRDPRGDPLQGRASAGPCRKAKPLSSSATQGRLARLIASKEITVKINSPFLVTFVL